MTEKLLSVTHALIASKLNIDVEIVVIVCVCVCVRAIRDNHANTRPDQSTFFVAVPWHLPLLHPKTYREWFSVKVPGDAPRLRVTFDRLVEPGIELGTRTNCMYYQPSSSS